MKKASVLFFLLIISLCSRAAFILIPMDDTQKDHLKAYGVAYYILQQNMTVQWLLNYRGGSFMVDDIPQLEKECTVRGVTFQIIAAGQAASILTEISNPEVNQDVVKLEKAPKVAVYSPVKVLPKLPWDDAVILALNYAEIPYDIIYDEEVLKGLLPKYDWLHLHHEDFTGQYGRFYSAYHNTDWYMGNQRGQEEIARKLGFKK